MSLTHTYLWVLMVLFCSSCGSAPPAEGDVEPAKAKPNVVFILADDLGYGDLGVYNAQSKIPTPHLDQLAAQGMRFTDAHTPSSVCTPTRYGLLTGTYAWRTELKNGVLQTYDLELIADTVQTLADVFQQAGYTTAAVGKWHLGFDWQPAAGIEKPWPIRWMWKNKGTIDLSSGLIKGGPSNAGFEYFFGFDLPNAPPYCFWENEQIIGPIPTMEKPDTMYGNKGLMQEGWDLSVIFAVLERKALEYIAGRTGDEQPFFLYLPLIAPHVPLVPSPDVNGKSEAGDYGDYTYEVDRLVGRVRQALEKAGKAENTLVVFTSDNGSPARVADPYTLENYDSYWDGAGDVLTEFHHDANAPWKGMKGSTYEGGHRVPMIVHWPGQVAQGSVNHQPVCLVDWMAAVHDLTGQDVPAGQALDSYNLLPTLFDPEVPVRDHVVSHSSTGNFALRWGDWKLIEPTDNPSRYDFWLHPEYKPLFHDYQLYHLATDPGEQNNVLAAHPDKAEELKGKLAAVKQGDYRSP